MKTACAITLSLSIMNTFLASFIIKRLVPKILKVKRIDELLNDVLETDSQRDVIKSIQSTTLKKFMSSYSPSVSSVLSILSQDFASMCA